MNQQKGQVIFCDYREHANQQINKICLNENCNLRFTCCDKCQNESHKSHKQDCQSLDQISQLIQFKIQQYSQTKDAVEDIFIRIKQLLFDFIESLQTEIMSTKELLYQVQQLKFSNVKKDIHRLKSFYKQVNNQSSQVFNIDLNLQTYTNQLINYTDKFQNIQKDEVIQNKEQNIQPIQEIRQNQDNQEIRNVNQQNQNIQQSNVNPQDQVQQISDEEILNNLILASAFLDQAIQLYNEKNYLDAEQVCDSVLELDQGNQDAIGLKVNALTQMNKYQEIIEFIDKFPIEKINQYTLQIFKGEALIKLKKYQEALVNFEEVLKLKPQNKRGLEGWVNSLILLNRAQEAIEKCNKLDQKYPQNSELKFLLGFLLEYSEQTNQALACYNDAINFNPQNFKAYRRRVLILIQLKHYNEALNDINKIIQSQNCAVDDYQTKSFIHLQLKQYNEALGTCNQGLALEPQNQELILLKQQILTEMKQNNPNSRVEQ